MELPHVTLGSFHLADTLVKGPPVAAYPAQFWLFVVVLLMNTGSEEKCVARLEGGFALAALALRGDAMPSNRKAMVSKGSSANVLTLYFTRDSFFQILEVNIIRSNYHEKYTRSNFTKTFISCSQFQLSIPT